VKVVGTYFIVYVADMERATRFYTDVFNAQVRFGSPHWSSLEIAGSTVGLHPGATGERRETGLGFDVDDIDAACEAVIGAGGNILKAPEHKPDEGDITLATIADTEGNELTLSLAR
jgi:predicted enzyme related to lactoylglutathione lyase